MNEKRFTHIDLFSVQPVIVPACAIGAIHRRDRVWILAYRNSSRFGKQRRKESKKPAHDSIKHSAKNVTDCENQIQLQQSIARERIGGSYHLRKMHHQGWENEPALDRVVYGVPERSREAKSINAQNKAFGNSIVPQVAEVFTKAIFQILSNDRP